MHDIMQSVDSKQQTDLVILDFSKAFDTMPHRNLLFKINKYDTNCNINCGFCVSWCTESNKLLLKGSPLGHALLTLEYLRVVF